MPKQNEPTRQTNQQGQVLGRKGRETRSRLMQAARRLLESYSPVQLTAVSIAQEAQVSPASFYMYFEDVRDVLYALAEEATEGMAEVMAVVDAPWGVSTIRQNAARLVHTYSELCDRNRQVLRFRNLEADRGDPRFEALRARAYEPFIGHLGRRIVETVPAEAKKPTLSQAFALATVIHVCLERILSTEPAVMARGVGARKLNEALEHVIVLLFTSGTDFSLHAPLAVAKTKTNARAPRK